MSEDPSRDVDGHRRFRSSLELVLTEAARRANVEIDLASVAHVTSGGTQVVNAAIKDLTTKSIAELNADGAIGLIYLPRGARGVATVPDGFYVVRLAPGNTANLVNLSGGKMW